MQNDRPKMARVVVTGDDLNSRIQAGVEKVYQVAKTAYGPKSGNVVIEQVYGDPLVSHDGVTNVEKVYLEDPIENQAAAIVKQASKKSNKKVGDGTTGVVILAYHLYKAARTMISDGKNPMEVSKLLKETAADIVKQLDQMKIPVKDDMLRHVANISAGDPEIGAMIADVISDVGIDGGVTIEDFAGAGIYNEIVDGFYFRKGFTNINLVKDPSNLESKLDNIRVLVSEKRLQTAADIAPILEKVVGGGVRELLIVGDVGEEALGVLILNRLKGVIDTTVVDAPVFDAMRSLFLEDLALYTDAKTLLPGANPNDFNIDMLGVAERVIVNEHSTTVLGGDGNEDSVGARITELRKQLAGAESEVTIDALKGRLSRLSGKVAIVRVGGSVEAEQQETKLRVQDAICAVQAAIKDGVVPGGGLSLARIKPLAFEGAFQAPFKTLVENAGYNSSEAIWKALQKDVWYGYNLRDEEFNYEPIDLLKAGVVDPTSVMKEVVLNASSVVSQLISIKASIYHADRKAKID